MRKTWIVLLSLVCTVLVISACNGDDDVNENTEDNASEEANVELPEPDLEGIPEVVAEINGEEVTKEEFESAYQQQFQQAAMQSQLSGEEIDEDQLKEHTVEGLIGQQLLTQEANNRFPDVSEDDVNQTMDTLVEENGMETKEELIAAFEEQGMEEEELMSLLETQVKIDQLIMEESGDIEPTDEEIEEVYEMLKAQQEEMGSEEEIPDFEEIKPDLKEQLKQQKEAEKIEALVQKLREDADITIFS